jgi:galactokinase
VERGIAIVARPHAERTLVVRDAKRREAISLPFDVASQGSVPWAVYPRTVLRRLVHNFGDLVQGCDIALASNLPAASGVSSSSALTVGLTVVLATLSGLPAHADWQSALYDRVQLAGYVGALENGADFGVLRGERGVGTMGGAQDQTAILCCAPGQLDVFGWAPVRHERSVTWPSDYTFVIGVSGIVATKTGGARERYNRVARTAHRLVDSWNSAQGGHARTLFDAFMEAGGGDGADAPPSALLASARAGADAEFTVDALEARLQQFHDETFRLVPQAAEALATGDLHAFGARVAESQAGAERALANQIPATIALVALANELGAVASSAFGAGFGGSVWAMVRTDEAEQFAARWRDRYVRGRSGHTARTHFFVTAPSAPAFEVLGASRVGDG